MHYYLLGGWGKPPVDEAGKPLYGDVFGTSDSKQFPTVVTEEVRSVVVVCSVSDPDPVGSVSFGRIHFRKR